jgi:RNA recognition motif-containing protein
MNFPNVLRISIIAAILAVVAFLITNFMAGLDATSIALSVLVGAFVAPFFSSTGASASATEQNIKTLYVGNLPYRANETVVRQLFSAHGMVHSVRLMKDKNTGKRRGFGFVEMGANDADNAIKALNDTEFQQRTLKIREAKERPDKQDEYSDDE